jgi:hypothetical protein
MNLIVFSGDNLTFFFSKVTTPVIHALICIFTRPLIVLLEAMTICFLFR